MALWVNLCTAAGTARCTMASISMREKRAFSNEIVCMMLGSKMARHAAVCSYPAVMQESCHGGLVLPPMCPSLAMPCQCARQMQLLSTVLQPFEVRTCKLCPIACLTRRCKHRKKHAND